MKRYEEIMEIALNRLIFFPSHEIYGGKAGFYDFGNVGARIKRKIENYWREFFVRKHNFYELEGAIVTPEIVLKASGHVEEFTDPAVACKKCGKKYRADKLVEEKEKSYVFDGNKEKLEEKIKELGIKCKACKGELGEVFFINLMFPTQIGYDGDKAYLRPETAQNIFTSFSRVFKVEKKLPIAIAQIGRSFRNEISPRNVLVRLREMTQMEIEYFFEEGKDEVEGWEKVKDKKFRIKLQGEKEARWLSGEEFLKYFDNKILAFFLVKEWEFYANLGLKEDKMWFRFLEDNETPHYSKANVDMEVETSFGVIEIAGNAYRTDYDLKRHAEFSKKNIEVNIEGRKFIPHVVELSMGVDRLMFCLLEHSFVKNEKGWSYFSISPLIAPYEVSVYPLMKKDGLKEKAKEVEEMLKERFDVYYRESGSIGKRYARGDEIAIPYAITIDYQSLEDDTVTLRYRDDGKQERIAIKDLVKKIEENIRKGKTKLE